jgi:hypothetical protein
MWLKLYLLCPCLEYFDLSIQCFTLSWSRLCWCMSPQKLLFVITYLLEDEQELSLGMLDTSQTYLWFLMLDACFTPIALCFVYNLWHFYAFSGTNLLTRCHSASSCFLLFLCFGKVTQEIFSEMNETKAGVPIYLKGRQSPDEWRSQTRRRPHHWVARATHRPCH